MGRQRAAYGQGFVFLEAVLLVHPDMDSGGKPDRDGLSLQGFRLLFF